MSSIWSDDKCIFYGPETIFDDIRINEKLYRHLSLIAKGNFLSKFLLYITSESYELEDGQFDP